MVEAYVVGMVMPQQQYEEDDTSDDIEALFNLVTMATDKQTTLVASFEITHREEVTR
jgi:hypothetical protein